MKRKVWYMSCAPKKYSFSGRNLFYKYKCFSVLHKLNTAYSLVWWCIGLKIACIANALYKWDRFTKARQRVF